VRRHEASILPQFRWLMAVSQADRQALLALGALPERVRVLPNLPDPRLLAEPPLRFRDLPSNVLYLGTLGWLPNSQGLRDFLRDTYPLIQRALPASRLVIAGSDAPSWLRRAARRQPGLELITPVAEPETLYSQARVFLETVRGGGGTKVKVLNALARGLPVVTTTDGAEGIDAVAEQHLLVADSPRSIVAAVEALLADEAVWKRLSDNGRALIQKRYRPDIAYRPLDDILAAVA
jgi:glycosyltransferase involved in cell wall biosynthesis